MISTLAGDTLKDEVMQENKKRTLETNRIIAIHTPDPGKVRVRKIVKLSNTYSTGKYPSWKMGRMVQWKSPHLLAALRLLDATPAVKSFQEEVMKIEYGRYPGSAIDREQIRQVLVQCGPIDWETISNGLLGPNGRQIICRFALEGLMRFNIKEIWSGATRFQLNPVCSTVGAN